MPNPVENVCNIVKQGPHLKSPYGSPNQAKQKKKKTKNKKNRIGNRQSKFQTTSHTHTHTHSAQMSNFHMSFTSLKDQNAASG
jgi:hypothetical protein